MSTSKFFKDSKIAWACKKFLSAYLHEIAQKLMLLLVNNLHEKHITELIWTFGSTHIAICN